MTLNEYLEILDVGEASPKMTKRVLMSALMETATIISQMDEGEFALFDRQVETYDFLLSLANLEDDDFFGTEGLKL